MSDPSEATSSQREGLLRPEVHDYAKTGYEQCWYPIAQSKDVPAGKIIGEEFLDGRVILYRDSQGSARVMTAYCPHMGADLSTGEILGDDIRCAFHHWQYGPDGVCNNIPSLDSADKIPRKARVFSYPTEERLGLIWVFNGVEPLFPVPTFEDRVDMSKTIYKVFENNEDFKADPWWIFSTNAFDFQHLRHLHGLDEILEASGIESLPIDVTDYSIGYAGAITTWGVNVNVGIAPERNFVGGGTPCLSGRRKGYRVYSANTGDGSPEALAKAEQHIEDLYKHETRIIMEEDVPVVETLNYRAGGLMVPADKELLIFLRFAERYPRIRMADLIDQASQ